MRYLEFNFEETGTEKNGLLVALLSQAGFTGFQDTDDESSMKAYISEQGFDQDSFENIIKQISVKYSVSTLEEKNWNAVWESDFEPVTILDPVSALPFASIRAGFHEPEKRLIHELIITPKMSFGTGHHATTYLMVERMCQVDFSGKYVIDFGTGTGVLAILAAKMGATEVLAIDNDQWSIDNTNENIEANLVGGIQVTKAEKIITPKKADIILANINLNIIIENLPDIITAAENGTILLLSGIMVKDKEEILSALSRNFIEVINCFEKQHWLCIECLIGGDQAIED